jgi:hypothetical protein
MALPPNAVQILDQNDDALNTVVENSLGVMPEGLSPEEQEEFRARQLAQMQNGQQNMDTLFHANQQISDATEDAMAKLPAAASSYFDLKTSQFDPMMNDQDTAMMNDPQDPGTMFDDQGYDQFEDPKQFDSHIDLFNYLEEMLGSGDPEQIDSVRNDLLSMVGNEPTVDEQGIQQPNPQQVIADSLQDYLRALQEGNEQRRAELAMKMFRSMPQSDQGDTMIQGVEQVVSESNKALRVLAQGLAEHYRNKQASGGGFNLKKEAQHKAMENVIMHGPNGNRIDPFTGQLINDWHVYERNKGWGLKMDDALFVDYEAIWRGNIMDKYSKPYRDADGNYVGGYIEKRFEVDKWIPPGNNYQLKPGEKRRPYLPEYRSTEARMQQMRHTNEDSGREFNDTSAPFNWAKEASSKRLTKTAQFDAPTGSTLTFIVQDLNEGTELQRINAPAKDQALQQAQAIARQYGQPVMLLTYDTALDEMDPIEEDMIWPEGSAQSVAASADSKKKVTD